MKLKFFLINPVFQNIFWLMSEKAFTLALILYSEGLIAKLFSKHLYGQWVYSLNIVILLSSFALIAGAEVAVPAICRNKKINKEIISAIFIVRLFFAVIAFSGVNIFATMFIMDLYVKSFIIILSFIILLNEPISVIINYYQANIKIKKIVFFRIVSLALRMLIVFISYKLLLDYKYIALARVAECLLLFVLLLFLWRINNFGFKINKKIMKVLFIRGLHFWPSLMLMYLYLRADRFFIEHYTSFSVLAMYGVAVQLTEQTFILTKMIIQSASPKYIFGKLARSNLKKNIYKLVGIITVINIVIMITCFFSLPLIISFLFGEKYLMASHIAVNMLPALLFYSLDSVFMQYLFREKMGKAMIIKWSVGLLIMSLLYPLYFGFYQGQSLTIMYNINYFIMLVLTVVLFLKGFKNA